MFWEKFQKRKPFQTNSGKLLEYLDMSLEYLDMTLEYREGKLEFDMQDHNNNAAGFSTQHGENINNTRCKSSYKYFGYANNSTQNTNFNSISLHKS